MWTKDWRKKALNKDFRDRLDEIVLTIGKQTWTRQEVVEKLKVGNFRAAIILNNAVAAHFPDVKSVAQLAQHADVETLFAIKGVGVTTVYVFMCVLESVHRSPLLWLDKKEDRIVKLGTYKQRTKEPVHGGEK